MSHRVTSFVLAATIWTGGMMGVAICQDQVTIVTSTGRATCADFRRHSDGSWSALSDIHVSGPSGSVDVPADIVSFYPGMTAPVGYDLGTALNNQCPAE